MNVCVAGLWHLGSVTAACLSALGHRVVGLDGDAKVVAALNAGTPPLFEPGLKESIEAGLRESRLTFTTDAAQALASAQVVWITYDTPVDDDDVADVESVLANVRVLFDSLADGTLVILSSQLIAGCTRRLEEAQRAHSPHKRIDFAYSPENLRLGKAIQIFMQPDRVVMGIRSERSRGTIEALLPPIAPRILWTSVESAEMTKHALNAFLAMSVAFANEIAAVCEQVGADAKEVERALKSEQRIGPGAYVSPGAAFAGGTLARDVQYLRALAQEQAVPATLLSAIKQSNDDHRRWNQRKLEQCLGSLSGRKIAVLGLTYKPETDTLRRSASIELCRWLIAQGALVQAHDPRVSASAPELPAELTLHASALAAVDGAEALVLGTSWPEYRTLGASQIQQAMRRALVIDAARSVAEQLASKPGIEYHAVGTPRADR